MKSYTFKVEETATGFSAHCTNHGVTAVTTGGTVEELQSNAAEAISLLTDTTVTALQIKLELPPLKHQP